MRGGDEAIECAGFADHRGDLGCGFAQHLNFFFAKNSRLDGLDHKNPLQNAAVDEGNSEEGLVGVLAGFMEILKAGVAMGLLHCHRTHLLSHQSGKAFVDGHAQLADALRAKADGCGQD